MRQSRSVALATAAPSNETNPDAGAVGTSALAARSDHQHSIAAAATPAAETFGAVASQGAGAGFATDTHVHAMPSTWTKVAAGLLASAASLDLSGLSGYRRYHLIINARVAAPGTTNWIASLKLNNGASHNAQQIKATNATITGVSTAAAATVAVASLGANVATADQWDLLVTHDDLAASHTSFRLTYSRMGNAAATDIVTVTGGAENAASASITEILASFGLAYDAGNYVLYGSNEVA